MQYGAEICTALEAGGLNMDTSSPFICAPKNIGGFARGIFIQVSDPKKPPPLAKKLAGVLNDAGLGVTFGYNYGFDNSQFILSVGTP
jgi:hypothetical protein